MARTIVGILRGGSSGEYELSLKTGAAMHAALPEDKYDTRDIFIDRNGLWHLRGLPATPARALAQVDVALIGLHGGAGEDGTVQRILERAGIPYAGARPHAAGLSLNKARAREFLRKAHIRMPEAILLTTADDTDTARMAREVFQHFGPPYVVKAVSEGSSRGIRFAPTIVELPAMIGDVIDAHGSALVEQYVHGDEVHAGVIEGFRGEELYALPVSHVQIPSANRFYNPYSHGLDAIRHTVPSKLSFAVKDRIADMMRAAHRALGMSHFSAANFIVTKSGPYLLEVDAIPHLYQGAAFPPMLEAVGSSTREFLEHAISLARK